ncbi:MAG: transposase [Verrucomicrobiales bacterium]|jgi:transposase
MRYHTSTTQYHCGIDLHSTQMYVCVMDTSGKVLLHMNIRGNDFDFFLHKIAPWRHDMTVCCECIFNWYWMADACHAAGLQFVLAHALYLKAIHGGKKQKRPHRLRKIDPPATQQSHPTLKGLRGAKLGNAYLRWAFGEAAVLAKRHNSQIAALADHQGTGESELQSEPHSFHPIEPE